MSTARSSITVTNVSRESMNPPAIFSNSSWFITLGVRVPGKGLGDRGS